MKLKRIAQTLLIASLSTTTMAAFSATTPDYPASVEPIRPLIEEFPNIDTYKREHRNSADSAANQAPMTYPSAGLQEYPLSGEFPNMQTYQDIHKNDPVAQSTTPTFPYSVDPVRSMAEEGLVPGIAGVAPYDNRYVNRDTQTTVGSTR